MVSIINHAHDENEPCTSECRTPSGKSVMTDSPTKSVAPLSEEAPDILTAARELLNRVTLPAEVNAATRELLPKLCDEIEAHREHLEFCFHNHVMESELTRLRERAIEIVNRYSICRDHDQPSHCVHCDLRHKATAEIRGTQ